jgi:hypothetical protein
MERNFLVLCGGPIGRILRCFGLRRPSGRWYFACRQSQRAAVCLLRPRGHAKAPLLAVLLPGILLDIYSISRIHFTTELCEKELSGSH